MIIAFKDAWLTSLLGCWHSVRASEGEATALNALSTTPSPPNTTRWGVGFSRGAQSYYCDLYLPLGFDWTRSDLCGGRGLAWLSYRLSEGQDTLQSAGSVCSQWRPTVIPRRWTHAARAALHAYLCLHAVPVCDDGRQLGVPLGILSLF